MDTCDKQKEKLLRDYFMNRLSADEVEAFQFHLFHCQLCQEKLKRMRQLAHDEEDIEALVDKNKSSESIFSRMVSTWMRTAALVSLLLIVAAGSYYYLSTPEEEEWQLEMNQAPLFHSGDSVQEEADSMHVDVKEKECSHGK